MQEDIEISNFEASLKDRKAEEAKDKKIEPTGALDRMGKVTTRKAKSVFRVWTIVFALVGAQMSWVLRPFIGYPDAPTQFFRQDAWGNAYVRLANIILSFIGG